MRINNEYPSKQEVIATAEKAIHKCGGYSFTGEDFRNLTLPCVYLFLDSEDKALYIGMSGSGITRPTQKNHRQPTARLQAHRILIYPCNSTKEAKHLETLLIKSFMPSLNFHRKNSTFSMRKVEIAKAISATYKQSLK